MHGDGSKTNISSPPNSRSEFVTKSVRRNYLSALLSQINMFALSCSSSTCCFMQLSKYNNKKPHFIAVEFTHSTALVELFEGLTVFRRLNSPPSIVFAIENVWSNRTLKPLMWREASQAVMLVWSCIYLFKFPTASFPAAGFVYILNSNRKKKSTGMAQGSGTADPFFALSSNFAMDIREWTSCSTRH